MLLMFAAVALSPWPVAFIMQYWIANNKGSMVSSQIGKRKIAESMARTMMIITKNRIFASGPDILIPSTELSGDIVKYAMLEYKAGMDWKNCAVIPMLLSVLGPPSCAPCVFPWVVKLLSAPKTPGFVELPNTASYCAFNVAFMAMLLFSW